MISTEDAGSGGTSGAFDACIMVFLLERLIAFTIMEAMVALDDHWRYAKIGPWG